MLIKYRRYTWCGGCPPFVHIHNQDWLTLQPPPAFWYSRMYQVASLPPKISSDITRFVIFHDTRYTRYTSFFFNDLILWLSSVYLTLWDSIVTLAFWMASGGRYSLGNANAPPSTGWQQKPGRLLRTSRALFTLWTNMVLMFCVSCRTEVFSVCFFVCFLHTAFEID